MEDNYNIDQIKNIYLSEDEALWIKIGLSIHYEYSLNWRNVI